MADEKKYLRAIMATSRSALHPAWVRAHSAPIQRRILDSPGYQHARSVMLYAAAHNEVATDALLEHALASGRAVYFPRLEKSRGLISAVRIHSRAELRPGAFGILEPDHDLPPAALASLGNVLVCVPGLAFSRDGQRLGRGGGHYDRFLATSGEEAISVGLAYSFQLLGRLPHEGHDRRLNFIATESALHCSGDAPLLDGNALTEEVHPGESSDRNPGIYNWWRGLSDLGVNATAQGRR